MKVKSLADRSHDRFYRWFERQHSEHQRSLMAEGFSRRDLRDAFEAGVRAQKRGFDIRGEKNVR